MHDSVGGFQGCYLDNHRNNWRCARTVRALCPRCAKTPPWGGWWRWRLAQFVFLGGCGGRRRRSQAIPGQFGGCSPPPREVLRRAQGVGVGGGGGGWHAARLCCCLQPAAPIGLSPFTPALPLNPLPPQAAAPIGLSPPRALPPPAWPILASLLTPFLSRAHH